MSMTILRHPSLPEVEPKPLTFPRRSWVLVDTGDEGPMIAGPERPTEAEAIAAWNDWVRPLVELQAEVERLRALCLSISEHRAVVQTKLADALENVDAANARAERYREVLCQIRRRSELRQSDWEPFDAEHDAVLDMARLAAGALTDQPEQPT